MKLRQSLQAVAILTGLMLPTAGASWARLPQSLPSNGPIENQLSLNFPSSPKRDGAQATVGGGRRGGSDVDEAAVSGSNDFSYCTDSSQSPLTGLAPSDRIAATVAANPSFYWFIPRTTATSAEFVLIDKEGNFIYSQYFSLPEQSGLVNVQLPQTLALKHDQSYRWKLSLVCDPLDRSYDEYVWGVVQRTQLDEAQKANLSKVNSPAEKANLYAQFYAWNETLDLIAQMRDSDPQEWQELLNSVGINNPEIIEAPFLGTLE